MNVADLCRREGFSSATFYKWRAKFGGMEASDAKRLRELVCSPASTDNPRHRSDAATPPGVITVNPADSSNCVARVMGAGQLAAGAGHQWDDVPSFRSSSLAIFVASSREAARSRG